MSSDARYILVYDVHGYLNKTPMQIDKEFLQDKFGGYFQFFNDGYSLFWDKPIAWPYICEKIPVPEADARPIADWMNAQLDFDHPQQGEYWMKYLTPSEPYPYAGEMATVPLCPEVING